MHELYGYMFSVQCEDIRIHHQTPLLVMIMSMFIDSCGGHIILRTSSDVFIFNLGLHYEGLF